MVTLAGGIFVVSQGFSDYRQRPSCAAAGKRELCRGGGIGCLRYWLLPTICAMCGKGTRGSLRGLSVIADMACFPHADRTTTFMCAMDNSRTFIEIVTDLGQSKKAEI